MSPIGGDEAKFIQLDDTGDEDTVWEPTSLRIVVNNPHLVVIGEVLVEVTNGKIHVTARPMGDSKVDFVMVELP